VAYDCPDIGRFLKNRKGFKLWALGFRLTFAGY
jgi:hypothetical protein